MSLLIESAPVIFYYSLLGLITISIFALLDKYIKIEKPRSTAIDQDSSTLSSYQLYCSNLVTTCKGGRNQW